MKNNQNNNTSGGEIGNAAEPNSTDIEYPYSVLSTIVPRATEHFSRAFHYTDTTHLFGIVADRIIQPSFQDMADLASEDELFDDPNFLPGPLVWMSLNPIFEPVSMAGSQLRDSVGHYLYAFVDPEYTVDAARIEVKTDSLYEWSAMLDSQGFSPSHIAGLALSDQELGSNPCDWCVSDAPLGIDKWLMVEVWDGDAWIPIAESNSPKHRAITTMLPSFLSCRTTRSGAGNELISLIRDQGGHDRVGFAEAEFALYQNMAEDIYDTPFELLCDSYTLDPVFSVVHAIKTLNAHQAHEILRIHGPAAWDAIQNNYELKRFVKSRLGLS